MEIAPASSAIRSVELQGPAGRLEALLNTGKPDAPFTSLVCHPHPMGGGTMHNKVVYHAMKALHGLGIPVLRFNFRGTGRSEGGHDNGHGEQDDVHAALDWLEMNFRRPILFAGFSFGANVGMRACCGDSRVLGLIALGLPVLAEGRMYTYKYLPECRQPKLFISGDHDQYGPVAGVQSIFDTAHDPKQLIWIAGADHFFVGKLDQVQVAIASWVTEKFLSSAGSPNLQ
ncbi:MAG TPA: alpha/beta family hydrolase [Acidobacteriaceae bacterium]|nr:alpha/beta family hydrolase [Acidobacteriaceae bacterium]